MPQSTLAPSSINLDPLGIYISGVSKLPEKFGLIAANNRDSALSLGRAAAALRSLAALSPGRQSPEKKAATPATLATQAGDSRKAL